MKNKVFNRRAFILGGVQFTISAIFSYRLYTLQVRDEQKYKILSDNNKIKVTTIIPQRGKILDRNSIEIAVNKISYVVVFDKKKSSREKSNWKEIYSDKEKSSPEEKTVAFFKRYYPFGSICSHILGYTKREQGGISGIEYIYDDTLRGISGKIEQEVSSKKHVVKELSSIPPQNGKDVKLTIDINLQKKVAEIFHKNKGSVIILDVRSGEVLALYNSPAYDNNLFTSGLSNEAWESLNTPLLPLVNRALSYQIPLGSIFKVIVALTALQDGIITPQKKFLCTGHMMIGNRKFHCWKRDGHGYISLNEAIASSCNTYFYNIGKEINIDSLVEMASKFGIGNGPLLKTFKEETPGLLPKKDWRKQKQWQLGDTINLVIGQGYILTTPMQLSVLAARLATGKEILPCIEIKKVMQDFSDIDVDCEHLAIVQKAMFDTVNSKIGTAYTRDLPKGVQIAGKTGTPEINSQGQSHKLFIAYSSSSYAISVFIEHGTTPRQDFSVAYKIFNYMVKVKYFKNKFL